MYGAPCQQTAFVRRASKASSMTTVEDDDDDETDSDDHGNGIWAASKGENKARQMSLRNEKDDEEDEDDQHYDLSRRAMNILRDGMYLCLSSHLSSDSRQEAAAVKTNLDSISHLLGDNVRVQMPLSLPPHPRGG